MPVYGSTSSTSDVISGRKYLIGGVAVFILIVAIMVVVYITTSGGKDSFVLDRTPLFAGRNNLPQNIQLLVNNNLSRVDLNSDLRNDSTFDCPQCNTDFPRLKKGQVSSQFWIARSGCDENSRVSDAISQLDVIDRMIKKYPDQLQRVKHSSDLDNVFENKKIGSLIGIDGGQSIMNTTAFLRVFYDLGVRALTLATGCNEAALLDYIVQNGTLTDFGETAVREMNRLGMIIDAQGLSTDSLTTVLNISTVPIMISHSAAADLYGYPNNTNILTLDALKSNDGLFMITFDTVNFGPPDNDNISRSDVIHHINYIVDRIGFDNIAIGGNYDSMYKKPSGLEDVSDFPDLFTDLKNNNSARWSPDNLDKLAGLNFKRFFQNVEKGRNTTQILDDE
ncbi:hypothetical protein HHI36_002581 [Cryptolaemus montrouzieri]|uniref:Dipeptidase n=1 Tax=Cryptolaemus montrouzieri TaxID=559131 RepID=A0ABD2PB28_9CUCU